MPNPNGGFSLLFHTLIFPAWGATLNIGDNHIHLTNIQMTSPSLVININGETFYGAMRRGTGNGLCVQYGDVIYNVYGMQQLEYLYFDGNSYIDLGFPPSANLNFEIRAWMDNSIPNHDGCLLGARNGNGTSWTGQYVLWYTNDNGYCGGAPHILPAFGAYDYNQQIIVDDMPQIIKLENGVFSVNDIVYDNLPVKPDTPNNLALGAIKRDNDTDARKFLGRVYYAKFWNSDGLLLNLIPIMDSKGTKCMYDTVSQKCFYNQGSGEFK